MLNCGVLFTLDIGHIYHFLLPVYEAEFQKNLRISKSTYL